MSASSRVISTTFLVCSLQMSSILRRMFASVSTGKVIKEHCLEMWCYPCHKKLAAFYSKSLWSLETFFHYRVDCRRERSDWGSHLAPAIAISDGDSIILHRQVVFEGRVEKAFHPETWLDYVRQEAGASFLHFLFNHVETVRGNSV